MFLGCCCFYEFLRLNFYSLGLWVCEPAYCAVCIMGELAGGGSVAVDACASDT